MTKQTTKKTATKPLSQLKTELDAMANQTNLHTLACELARMDNEEGSKGYNASVIGAQATLSALGRKLRKMSAPKALQLIADIIERSGVRADKA